MLKTCKLSFIYFSMLLLFFFTITDKLHAQKPSLSQKNIMVLHGEWQLWKWGKTFDSALYNRMYAQNDLDLRVTFEFLGLESIDQGVYPQKVIENLHYKIQKNPLDLVIAVLPQANEFLLSYGQKTFPGVPKIFALPDEGSLENINNQSDSVVIPSSSNSALKITVERILSILPDTEELVVVCGNSPHDLTYLKIAKEAIARYEKEIKTSYLIGEPMDQLLPRVSNLPRHAVILFLTYGKDKNNKKLASSGVVFQISKRANVPIFGFFDTLIDHGIVGGNLTSSEQYAEKAADIGLKILGGEQVSSISPVKDVMADIYDWRQLKRWNISEDRLPPESTILYKTETLWESHKATILTGLLFICFQTILIFQLIITIRRQNRTKNDLKESEKQLKKHHDHLETIVKERTIKIEKTHNLLKESKDRLHGLIQNIQAGIVVHGPDTKIKDCNKAALELFGLTKDQMFGKKAIEPSWRFSNEDGSDMPLERYPVNQVINSKNELKNMIVGIYRPDRDDIIKVLTNAVPGFDSDGNIFEVIVTFVDITDRIQAENARETILKHLQEALDNVKTLSGLVPICSNCKKIRDDKGYWNQIETHIQKHTSATFSHGICPECSEELYGDEKWYINMKKNQKIDH